MLLATNEDTHEMTGWGAATYTDLLLTMSNTTNTTGALLEVESDHKHFSEHSGSVITCEIRSPLPQDTA
jgi:hypothetical protein